MALTREDVFAIADKLEAEGTNPTQNLVREALGGGSFATIGPALKEWKDMKHKEHELVEVQVPDTVKDRFEQLQAVVWQAAADEADQRLALEKQAMQEAKVAAEAAVSDADEAVKILEKEAEEREAKIEKIAADLADAETRAENAQNEKNRAEQNHAAEVARLREKIEGLIARLEDAQTARIEARDDAEQARKDAKEAVSRVENELQRLTKMYDACFSQDDA